MRPAEGFSSRASIGPAAKRNTRKGEDAKKKSFELEEQRAERSFPLRGAVTTRADVFNRLVAAGQLSQRREKRSRNAELADDAPPLLLPRKLLFFFLLPLPPELG